MVGRQRYGVEVVLSSILDMTSWVDERSDNKITLCDVLDHFEKHKIECFMMKTKDIFNKFSKGEKVLSIVKAGGEESRRRVEVASLDYPIIVVKRGGILEYILDGNHRLQNAKNTKKEFIKVSILDLDDLQTPESFKNLF